MKVDVIYIKYRSKAFFTENIDLNKLKAKIDQFPKNAGLKEQPFSYRLRVSEKQYLLASICKI